MKVIVREGINSDLPQVLSLIRELADYEKCPNEVSNTAEDMERDGFGPGKVFNFIVADYNAKIVGAAIYYIKYSTWKGKCVFLEDIIVTESARGNKIGERLFERIIKVSKDLGVKRMEWQVLSWNEPAINFYKQFNANFDNEWINCKLGHEQLQEFKFDV